MEHGAWCVFTRYWSEAPQIHLAEAFYFLLDSLRNIFWCSSRSVNLTPLFMTLSIFAVPQGIPWIWQINKLLSECHLWSIIWWCPWCFSSSIFLISSSTDPEAHSCLKGHVRKSSPYPRSFMSIYRCVVQSARGKCKTCIWILELLNLYVENVKMMQKPPSQGLKMFSPIRKICFIGRWAGEHRQVPLLLFFPFICFPFFRGWYNQAKGSTNGPQEIPSASKDGRAGSTELGLISAWDKFSWLDHELIYSGKIYIKISFWFYGKHVLFPQSYVSLQSRTF